VAVPVRQSEDSVTLPARRSDDFGTVSVRQSDDFTTSSAQQPGTLVIGDASRVELQWPTFADVTHVASTDESRVFEPSMRLDGERLSDVGRLFINARCEGLVRHLFVLRFFFPDAVGAGADAEAVLDSVRGALRDVFDRLFVKLRIPGFDVSSDDLEDVELRQAAIALFERLSLFSADAVRVLPLLGDAPYGSPNVLRALVGLLSVRCEEAPPDGVLARYEGLPLELFDDALAHLGDRALDDARDALVDELRPHVAPVALAC
jgi:hypothetical protein